MEEDYQEELQRRVEEGMNVPESNFGKVVFGIALAGLVASGSLAGINYAEHNGPQRSIYRYEVESVAKPTGITGYVQYRKLVDVVGKKGDCYKRIDLIMKGDIFSENVEYFDYDQDKKVDLIRYLSKNTLLDRQKDYGKHKKEFDKADKYFVKYLKEFSK